MLANFSVRIFCIALVGSLMVAGGAAAQNQTPPPKVCMEESEFRQFDFWVGDWDVHDNTSGNLVGQNRIEARETGCLLVENWTASSGGTGMSINYYDSVTEKWRQVWVASNYSIDIEGGINPDGAMTLVGQLHNYRSGRSFDFRGTWTPNEDGTVRQFFEQKNPETGKWAVWFDGTYSPREG